MMNKSEHWRHRTFLLYGPCCSAFWRESPYLYRDCGANVSFLNFSKRHSQFNFKPETFVSHPSSNKNKCVVDLHVCVRKWLINDRIDRSESCSRLFKQWMNWGPYVCQNAEQMSNMHVMDRSLTHPPGWINSRICNRMAVLL